MPVVVASRGETWSRPSGWVWCQPGAIPHANLYKVYVPEINYASLKTGWIIGCLVGNIFKASVQEGINSISPQNLVIYVSRL